MTALQVLQWENFYDKVYVEEEVPKTYFWKEIEEPPIFSKKANFLDNFLRDSFF